MSIDEFLEGMVKLLPMIHRRALDLHRLEGGAREAYVKYTKWTSAGCEVHLR